jgi:hypothetical protein
VLSLGSLLHNILCFLCAFCCTAMCAFSVLSAAHQFVLSLFALCCTTFSAFSVLFAAQHFVLSLCSLSLLHNILCSLLHNILCSLLHNTLCFLLHTGGHQQQREQREIYAEVTAGAPQRRGCLAWGKLMIRNVLVVGRKKVLMLARNHNGFAGGHWRYEWRREMHNAKGIWLDGGMYICSVQT